MNKGSGSLMVRGISLFLISLFILSLSMSVSAFEMYPGGRDTSSVLDLPSNEKNKNLVGNDAILDDTCKKMVDELRLWAAEIQTFEYGNPTEKEYDNIWNKTYEIKYNSPKYHRILESMSVSNNMELVKEKALLVASLGEKAAIAYIDWLNVESMQGVSSTDANWINQIDKELDKRFTMFYQTFEDLVEAYNDLDQEAYIASIR